MRTSLLLAAAAFAALSIGSGSAWADDAAPPTAPATEAPRVVVVQTAKGPQPFQLAPEHKTKRVWYGWQTLTMDGVAIASGVILAKADYNNAGWVWVGTYAFAPPVVHALHGRFGIAFADLGVRVGAPVVLGTAGLLVGCIAASGNSNGDGFQEIGGCAVGASIGFLAGYATAIALDAAVFARETVDVDPNDAEEARAFERQRRQQASAFKIIPDVGLAQNRATLGVSGQF